MSLSLSETSLGSYSSCSSSDDVVDVAVASLAASVTTEMLDSDIEVELNDLIDVIASEGLEDESQQDDCTQTSQCPSEECGSEDNMTEYLSVEVEGGEASDATDATYEEGSNEDASVEAYIEGRLRSDLSVSEEVSRGASDSDSSVLEPTPPLDGTTNPGLVFVTQEVGYVHHGCTTNVMGSTEIAQRVEEQVGENVKKHMASVISRGNTDVIKDTNAFQAHMAAHEAAIAKHHKKVEIGKVMANRQEPAGIRINVSNPVTVTRTSQSSRDKATADDVELKKQTSSNTESEGKEIYGSRSTATTVAASSCSPVSKLSGATGCLPDANAFATIPASVVPIVVGRGQSVEDITNKEPEFVEFNVIVFAGEEIDIYITGNRECLGSWDVKNAHRLEAVPVDYRNGKNYAVKPTLFAGHVPFGPLDLTADESLQYKYVMKVGETFTWEGNIPIECGNRKLYYNDELSERTSPNANYHLEYDITLTKCNEHFTEKMALLRVPPSHFVVSATQTECHQTTSYYREVLSHNDMDYQYIGDEIILGSCPRTEEHFKHLIDLGVKHIVNLQTAEDVLKNGPCRLDGENNTIESYFDVVQGHDLELIWLPTTDMCTAARSRMVAQASYLMLGIMNQNNGKVYVHCNAGVGRSTAVIMAFLCLVLEWDIEKAHLYMVRRRPIVFVDKVAIEQGKLDFNRKYKEALRLLRYVNESQDRFSSGDNFGIGKRNGY